MLTQKTFFIFALLNLENQGDFINYCTTKSLISKRFYSFLPYKISRIKKSKTSLSADYPRPPPHFLQILHQPQVPIIAIIFWVYDCGHCWLWNIRTSHRLPDQDCRTSFRCVFLMLCTENKNMCLYLSQHVWTWKRVKM